LLQIQYLVVDVVIAVIVVVIIIVVVVSYLLGKRNKLK